MQRWLEKGKNISPREHLRLEAGTLGIQRSSEWLKIAREGREWRIETEEETLGTSELYPKGNKKQRV